MLQSTLLVLALAAASPSAEQTRPPAGLMGAELFAAGCAGCHGPEGSGAPDSTVGFQKPDTYPDFTGCDQTSPENEAGWRAVIHDGGKARGFSRIMPAFGELLTPEQITSLVKYIRGLCEDRAWPPGDLNFPRPLLTEKAFPESEWVIGSSIATGSVRDSLTTLFYEKRYGARWQVEFGLPFAVSHDTGVSHTGIGDMALGLKRVLFSNHATIFSVQGEVTLPTGNADLGLGSGVTVFETFGALGQRIGDGFVQAQVGAELPTDAAAAPRAVFGRFAVGRTLYQNRGFGRLWAPMLELVIDRDLEPGALTNVDVVPELQLTLSPRQHVRAAIGLQIPANHRSGRSNRLHFYVLWDFFDGGLLDGWK